MSSSDAAVLSLRSDRVESLGRLVGHRIECLSGTAWVTLDRDGRDIVLDAGQSFLVDQAATVRVSALDGSAQMALREPAETGGGSPWRRAGWVVAAVCSAAVSFALLEVVASLTDLSAAVHLHSGVARPLASADPAA